MALRLIQVPLTLPRCSSSRNRASPTERTVIFIPAGNKQIHLVTRSLSFSLSRLALLFLFSFLRSPFSSVYGFHPRLLLSSRFIPRGMRTSTRRTNVVTRDSRWRTEGRRSFVFIRFELSIALGVQTRSSASRCFAKFEDISRDIPATKWEILGT